MSFGPMIGLFMQGNFTYDVIFSCSLLSGSLGFIMAYMGKTPYKQPVKREPISLDRFFLVKGTWAGISLLLLSIPYGMTTTYVAMYAAEIGISVNSGLYFTFRALGLAVSRLFSGRQVDKGRITLVISLGMYLAAATFFLLAALKELMHWNPVFSSYLYIGIALSQGVAFGTMFPAFNTLFVNLAPNNQRGTATSTYLTSWDVGIGRVDGRGQHRTRAGWLQLRLLVWRLPYGIVYVFLLVQGRASFQSVQAEISTARLFH